MKSVAAALALVTLLPSRPSWGQEMPPPGPSLQMAALRGDVGATRQLIEAGADVNAKDAWGSTPLIVAATFGKTEVARALIDAGADLHLRNNDGATALHAAAFLCRTAIVRLLLDHGANKYLRDNFGNTPRESVVAPFDDVRGIYEGFVQGLGPLGFELDYEQVRLSRPEIAEMLRPRANELATVEYAPSPGNAWEVSTPEAQGLDPMLVAELYLDATGLSTLYGLLVIKNGHLIAEKYFNEGSMTQKALLQSASKSYTSALVGIALDRGCLSSVDQTMLQFFPELADRIADPRKREITIRHLLQMRAGYPWEETDRAFWDAFLYGDLVRLIVDFPLVSDPGTTFHYSNLSSHLLGVIVARACDTDLKSFAQEHVFSALDAEIGEWIRDRDGYYVGAAEMRFTARDAAKLGQLYLDGGEYDGKHVVPADWVRESLQRYSEDVTSGGIESGDVGRYLRHIGYGYQWWSATAGEHDVNLAWGHGGQLIVLLDELDLIVVTTAYPFYKQHDDESWRHERAILNVVGKFIASLPKGDETSP